MQREVNGNPLIYFDSVATSLTPRCVVEEITRRYETTKANVHRGVHTLSQEATELQEACRRRVQRHINAASHEEIIFTRGTTEAINLVASSYGQRFRDGDEIILTIMEHHADIVPWQLIRSHADVKLRVVGMNDRGELDLEEYRSLFNERTVMAAFCHVSNVLGTENPVKKMTAIAHSHGVPVLVDGAQAAPHLRIDVRDIGCDFYAFSAHKMYGPTGVGVLYGRKELLEEMPPYQGGGEMIGHVTFGQTTYADLPFKFEAGTPDFVGIASFAKAFEFIDRLGLENIEAHELELMRHTTELLHGLDGVHIYGAADCKGPVISFNVGKAHNYDVGLLLDRLGIAVRTGHHCAQPLMERLGVPGTVRAGFAIYNTLDECDRFVAGLKRILPMLM